MKRCSAAICPSFVRRQSAARKAQRYHGVNAAPSIQGLQSSIVPMTSVALFLLA